MFKAELSDSSILKTSFDAISSIVDEVQIQTDSEGMRLDALDRSHITFVHLELKSSLFDEYICDVPEKINIDTDEPKFMGGALFPEIVIQSLEILKEKLLKERDAIPTTRVERYSFGVESPNRDGNAMRGGIRKALRCMEQTPTADVVEVKHARWVPCKNNAGYKCSYCGARIKNSAKCNGNHIFCHKCGAKMDGERTEE